MSDHTMTVTFGGWQPEFTVTCHAPPTAPCRAVGDCNYALFLDASDCTDELGSGSVTFPVSFKWNGDGYEWHAEETP